MTMAQPSLRWLLPGLMAALVALSVLSATVLQYHLQDRQLTTMQSRQLTRGLQRLQPHLKQTLNRHGPAAAAELLRRHADTSGLTRLRLLDANDNVLLDTGQGDPALSASTLVLEQPLPLSSTTEARLVGHYDLAPLREELRASLARQVVWILLLTSVIAVILLALLQRWVVNPLNQVIDAASRLGHDAAVRLPAFHTREFQRLGADFNRTAGQLDRQLRDLAERQGLLQALADSLPDLALVLNAQGRCLGVFGDRSLLRRGVSRESLQDSQLQDHVIPELEARARRQIDAALEQNRPQRIEYDLLTHQGLRHFVGRIVPMAKPYRSQPAVLWLASDTTENHALQAEVRLMANAFETLEAIAITDDNLRLLKANRAFEDLSGYPAEEYRQRALLDLLCDEDEGEVLENLHHGLRRQGHWSGEIRHRRRDQSRYPAFLTVSSVLTERGNVGYYVFMFMDITERKSAEQLILWQAQYDPLTELPNRRYFLERLDEQTAVARRRKLAGAVLFLDLDHFKPINDSLGHSVGDALLRSVTQRLLQRLRREDFVARLGGDEFVVLIPALDTSPEQAAREASELGQALLGLFAEPFQTGSRQLHLGVSIGFCVFPKQGDNSRDILRRADTAMYAAKRQGRGLMRQFNADMESLTEMRLERLEELHRALDNDEFRLLYQPQFNVAGDIVVAEALLRWQHPTQGLLPPGEFIPVAEDSGLILRLGDWVLREAARQYREWHERDLLPPEFRQIAVNVSARQFAQPEFAETCLRAVADVGADPQWIELELTESVLADNLMHVSTTLSVLRDAGFHFAIDDFGTGYCSLHYLKRLPVETLKIDRMFIRDVIESESDARIVETILSMARHLDLRVVAEGVETEAQRRFLLERRCQLFQGYLFAQPLPAAELEARLKQMRDT